MIDKFFAIYVFLTSLHKTFEGMGFMCMLLLKISIVIIDIYLFVFGKCVDGYIKTWGVVKIDVQNKKIP